eukprot:13110410-Ditylum_brightwellii.AAC.1
MHISSSLSIHSTSSTPTNQSDVVTKLDYVEFMLFSMNLVSEDVLVEMHDQFDQLDVTNSGTLAKEDLKILAMKKMRSARKKLELSEYKKLLKEQKRHDQRRNTQSI